MNALEKWQGRFFTCIQRFTNIFKGRREHQLETVRLVDRAGAGVIVDGDDIRFREGSLQGLDHALAGDVVRQAGPRLEAHDVAGMYLSVRI